MSALNAAHALIHALTVRSPWNKSKIAERAYMAKIRAGVLGATGNVGQRFIEMLSKHPWFELTSLAASDRSAGKRYGDAASWRLESKIPLDAADMTVVPVDPRKVDADIVFSALPADLAKTVEPDFAKAGFAFIK